MKATSRRILAAAMFTLASLMISLMAAAQNAYPSRPITMVMIGPTDALASP